jgi:hypothetical protein
VKRRACGSVIGDIELNYVAHRCGNLSAKLIGKGVTVLQSLLVIGGLSGKEDVKVGGNELGLGIGILLASLTNSLGYVDSVVVRKSGLTESEAVAIGIIIKVNVCLKEAVYVGGTGIVGIAVAGNP